MNDSHPSGVQLRKELLDTGRVAAPHGNVLVGAQKGYGFREALLRGPGDP